MEVDEYLKYRKDLMDRAKAEDGFLSESSFIAEVLPSMLDAKLIDSEEWNETLFDFEAEKLKLNGYLVNESEERLQIILLNESSTDIRASNEDLMISQKAQYDQQFSRAVRFVKKAINGHLNGTIQDSHPVNALVSKLASSDGADQFDVIEIFLISATATVEARGNIPQPKRIEFDNENFTVTYSVGREKRSKEILIVRRLIDLNFLFDILVSQGNREVLIVNFEKIFGNSINAIKAANEANFESFLCVLPATELAELYRLHSSRLLEKNVRSFLDFKKEANQKMYDTMKKAPAKFIAFNNGLTITATDIVKTDKDGLTLIHSLTDFQIVNGGQTTASIYFAKKGSIDISKVFVTAKINVVKEAEESELTKFIKEISLYSNTQTKVSTVDLDSQNPQLLKLKSLTMSVMTPSGKKWFFDRASGEFNTMLRKSGNRKRLEKDYPDERRFTKEQLGKYFTAWGDQPYAVKKGGIKVFRNFMTAIGADDDKKKSVSIDREFYEETIAKIIFFNSLEKIYGAGKRSMGQLRSAVVPYSLAVLYLFSDGAKEGRLFDLSRIWVNEGLDTDLTEYMSELMLLVNELVKKYSDSEDYGENSKKRELWDRISVSKEILSFMRNGNSRKIIDKYSITTEQKKQRSIKNSKRIDVNFQLLQDMVSIFQNGEKFYQNLLLRSTIAFTQSERNKLEIIKGAIANLDDLTEKHIEFEREIVNRVRITNPEVFDLKNREDNAVWQPVADLVIGIYNKSFEQQTDLRSEFNGLQDIAKSKNIRYASVFGQIGEALSKGKLPSMKQLWYGSHILQLKQFENPEI